MRHNSKKIRLAITIFLGVSMCFSTVACSNTSKSKDTATTSASSNKSKGDGSIHIKYVGNSCFDITFADGTHLVTDPYGTGMAISFGPFKEVSADVVTLADNYSDHNSGLDEVKGSPKVIKPEQINTPVKVGDVEITGYAGKHVAGLGDEAIFVYKEGNFKIVHMGEADNIESPEVQTAIKDADVLLTYAGEYGTVKNKDSFVALNKLNVKVMIPQHFSFDPKFLWYGEPTIDTILTELPAGTKVTKATELIVKKDMEKQFLVLSQK